MWHAAKLTEIDRSPFPFFFLLVLRATHSRQLQFGRPSSDLIGVYYRVSVGQLQSSVFLSMLIQTVSIIQISYHKPTLTWNQRRKRLCVWWHLVLFGEFVVLTTQPQSLTSRHDFILIYQRWQKIGHSTVLPWIWWWAWQEHEKLNRILKNFPIFLSSHIFRVYA